MTERKRGVEDVLESMGRMVVPLADEPDAQRARIVAALDDKLDATRSAQKSRRRSRWLLACAACVTLAAALSVGHSLRANKAPAAQLEPSDLVRRGDAIATAESEHRSGHLENGAALSVFPSTELTVSALAIGGDELILDRGRIELKVPKLVAGRTLSITTPDATVTVRGTRFAVEVTLLDSHPITRVDVSEGSVWVRTGSERLVLEAGTHWTSRAADAASAHSDSSVSPASPALEASAVAPAAPAAAPTPSSAGAAPLRGQSAGSAAASGDASTLAEETSLYERAVRLLHSGQVADGLTLLDQLRTRYPRSPLAQNAAVERFRALRHSGRNSEAEAQARQYLADYPAGFARDEAKGIVADSLPKAP
ncbi:MAG TPA: FecR domain-containing protein [Polyangiaceae bacterium]|jgi:hypothetical protein